MPFPLYVNISTLTPPIVIYSTCSALTDTAHEDPNTKYTYYLLCSQYLICKIFVKNIICILKKCCLYKL